MNPGCFFHPGRTQQMLETAQYGPNGDDDDDDDDTDDDDDEK